MATRGSRLLPVASLVIGMAAPSAATAQVCQAPENVRARVPADAPVDDMYEPLGRGTTPFEEIPLGIGHLHHAPMELADLPPGDASWLQGVELPLSRTPDSAPSGWIVGGWIVSDDSAAPAPLSSRGLLETGYEELSFVVFDRSGDWLRIRYANDVEDVAWVPACALSSGPSPLRFTTWGDWFLSGEIAPLHARSPQGVDVHSEPSAQSSRLAVVARDDTLDPLEIRGEWMRVTLVRPSDFCRPEITPSRMEGWIRWATESAGPTVWYSTRGC